MNTQFTILPLIKVPEHYNEVITIIEKELGYSPMNHFANDFLPLVDPTNWHNCFVVFSGENVIGHIGIKSTTFFKDNVEIKIGLIGGISIKENFQGKGIFKKIFPQILNDMKNNFELFLLWSGEAAGYKKFGFYEIGKMIQTGEYDFDNTLRFFAKKLNHLTDEEKNYIKVSYQQSFTDYFKPKRTALDWDIFFRMSSVDVYFKLKNGSFHSYFMINKGQDLTQIIHEIGSHDPNEFQQLCRDLSKFKTWLPDNMGHGSDQSTFLFLGVFKLGNYENLLTLANQLGIILPEYTTFNEKEILENFLNSEKINFYIPGINSI